MFFLQKQNKQQSTTSHTQMMMMIMDIMFRYFFVQVLAFIAIVVISYKTKPIHGIPSPPYYYKEQLIDHFKNTTTSSTNPTIINATYWTQRYYQSDQYYNPNATSPIIFLILGGESSIEPSTGLLYPFITEHLASYYNAYVIQPEHRFYGTSQPINRTIIDNHCHCCINRTDPRQGLLTYEQALHDAIRLLQSIVTTSPLFTDCIINRTEYQLQFKYSDKDDHTVIKKYCRIIAVGGSYSGFLSTMIRIIFPSIIDIAYSASAPIRFYTQDPTLSQYEYYNHISNVAEMAQSGCRFAVQTTLSNVIERIEMNFHTYMKHNSTSINEIGICTNTIPYYATRNSTIFIQEIIMMVAYTFANNNMAYYPPSNETSLVKSCQMFLNDTISPMERLSTFFIHAFGDDSSDSNSSSSCFNMSLQLPAGYHATISSGDWSGVGTGISGDSWDYQTCTLLIEQIGIDNSHNSMFPQQRTWTMEWLRHHCMDRYGMYTIPQPYSINEKYHLNELLVQDDDNDNDDDDTNNTTTKVLNTSYILFTNGLKDGWSVSGIQTNISETIVALNFINGAHHSDLTHSGPSSNDTMDIQYGYIQIRTILTQWLNEIVCSFKEHHDNNNYYYCNTTKLVRDTVDNRVESIQ